MTAADDGDGEEVEARVGEPAADHGSAPGRHVRRGIAMSENLETRDTFVFSRTITREDVVGICQLMGLDQVEKTDEVEVEDET